MKNCNLQLLSLAAFMYLCSGCLRMSEDGWYETGKRNYPATEKYKDYEENPFVNVAEQAVSTFAIDADGASYSNMRRFAYLGQLPPKASVRIEEYINYFTFDYPEPADNENVALNSELAACPWTPGHYLLRVGMKGKTIPENELPDANFVFLIDVSGSMDSNDKLGILKTGFKQMVDEMRSTDKIAIVTYAGRAEVLLQSTFCDEKSKIKQAIDKLHASGSTAGGAGIQKAYEIAAQNFIPNGNNRIILGTDGDFNVGISNTDELVKFIEEKRDGGVYLTVLGVGTGNLNDLMMEQVANHGNGNYEYIDNAKQIKKVFIYEKSKFYTIAQDGKVQITFNPDMVNSYRLIGYENRTLNNEDFDDDTKDAGEIGSGQTITALYELVPTEAHYLVALPLGTVDFRYKKPDETGSRLLNHTIGTALNDISQSSENMRFATSVVCFGLQMKQSQYKGNASKQMVLDLASGALSFDPNGFRKEFLDLVKGVNF
ncbi:MAG: VWA domain-containing protein [Dysgonamonadaceae bacterium]|jgi:Ca-activated chloride channel family protein|nr:VWA domain-containing protein [Dysgonamonadaceae bacterium]